MNTIVKLLDRFMSGDSRSKQMLQLAKTEYGKDWEYAYHCLMMNKQINPRNTRGVEQ